ncbi:YfgM family protein [Acidithiobacillus sp. M4-SHS-6]|uniref:YfgM family protein n=1 Tax=Acidithiobacillus sp. M4-SHS-6 TaxID=3383024 RepID=UPI0039BDA649
MTGQEFSALLSRHRVALIVGVIVILLAAMGFFGYEKYQRHQTEKAAVLYNELVDTMIQGQNSSARASADTLIHQYGHTPYGTMARFFLARLDMESKQVPAAEKSLRVVMDNSAAPRGMRSLARMNLARLYVDQHQPQKALDLLQKPDPAFASIADEIKGDAYVSLKQVSEADQAYQAAMKALPETDPYRSYLQMKIANIGVTP